MGAPLQALIDDLFQNIAAPGKGITVFADEIRGPLAKGLKRRFNILYLG